jgi:hypothetical protein
MSCLMRDGEGGEGDECIASLETGLAPKLIITSSSYSSSSASSISVSTSVPSVVEPTGDSELAFLHVLYG